MRCPTLTADCNFSTYMKCDRICYGSSVLWLHLNMVSGCPIFCCSCPTNGVFMDHSVVPYVITRLYNSNCVSN